MYQVFGKWVKRSAVGIMLLSGIAAASFAVSAAQTEEPEKLLTKVDPAKGITYIYQEEGGTIAGINLNGNSVIIKMGQAVNADGKLVDSSSFNQIYIDKNRNGVVDGDEAPAVICDETAESGNQESVNVLAGPTIYGIYQQSSNTPIRITIDGGFAPVVYGVYEGEMTVKGETAVTMEAVSGGVPGTLYGEYGSKLTVEDATAVSVDYRIPGENTLSMCAAAYNGSVTVTGTETALKINVADGVIGTLMGGYGITLDAETTAVQMDIAGKITTGLHGLSSCERVQAGEYGAMVHLKDKAAIQGYAFVLYNSKVEAGKSAGVCEIASGANVTATLFGANGGTAATKTAGCPVIDVKIEGGASESNSLNQICGAYNSKVTAAGKEEEAVRIVQTGGLTNIYNLTGAAGGSHIFGNVLVDLKGTIVNPASFYGVSNGTEVDGDVTMRMKQTSGTSYFSQYGTSYYSAGFGSSAPCNITGNVSIVNGEDVGINTLYGMQGSTVQGNVTVDTYGRNEGNSYGGTIAGAYDSNGGTDMGVKGNVSLIYRGGVCSSLYGAYRSVVDGDVTVDLLGGTISNNAYGLDYSAVCKKNMTMNISGGTYYSFGAIRSNSVVLGDLHFTCGKESKVTSYYYIANGGMVQGNVDINIACQMSEDSSSSCYGMYSTQVGGTTTLTVDGGKYNTLYGIYSSNSLAGKCTVDIKNVKATNYLYGISGAGVGDEVSVTLTSIDGGSAYVYGYNALSTASDVTVCMTDVSARYLYGGYGLTGGGSLDVQLSDVTVDGEYKSLYAAYGGSIKGDVTVAIDQCSVSSKGGSFYGVYNLSAGGDVTATVTDSHIEADYFYACYQCGGDGAKKIIVEDCTCIPANKENSTYWYAVSSGLGGTADITVTGCTIGHSYVYPYSGVYSGGNGTANITFSGTEFTSEYKERGLSNYVYEGETAIVTIDPDCTGIENYAISPAGSGTGRSLLICGDTKYYGGTWEFDKSVTDNIVYIGAYSNIIIPKGCEFKATGGLHFMTVGTDPVKPVLLVEGTLGGDIANDQETEEDDAAIYLNGGAIAANNVDEMLYYPITLEYPEQAATIKPTGPVTNKKRPDVMFGHVGDDMTFAYTGKKGYTLQGVTVVKGESDTEEPAENAGSYTFIMGNQPARIVFDIQPDPLTLGKTTSDPVAKLNQEYTLEAPLYNLKGVLVLNDAEEGTVTYEVDKANGLPEGLTLEEGYILGTPTVAYEAGKKAVICITGKNGYKANLNLNIVVTAGEGQQTEQSGRILQDEENKVLNLLGNSVVIAADDTDTAIYLDDNRDGVADSKIPVCRGDLTEYTLYGIKDIESSRKQRITMTGGSIGVLYGASGAKLTDEGVCLGLDLQEGNIGKIYGMYTGTQNSGTMKLKIGKALTYTNLAPVTSATYKGYYYDNKGTVDIYGAYTLDEDVDADTLFLNGNSASLTIPEGRKVTLSVQMYFAATSQKVYNYGSITAERMYFYTTSQSVYNYGSITVTQLTTRYTYTDNYFYFYHRAGSLSVKNMNNYGWVYAQGGELPENNTWTNVYYPLYVTQSLEQATKANPVNNCTTATYDGLDTTRYGIGGREISVNIQEVEGYQAYYTQDDAEPVAIDGSSFTCTMPRSSSSIEVLYVPNDISITKSVSDPVGITGEEYTAKVPLYDLNTLLIENDSTAAYGGNITYKLQAGSALPKGLSLESGKIVGTPAQSGTSEVAVVVTGHNGATAILTLKIVIQDSAGKIADPNDVITVSGKTINLNGSSVVLTANADSSTTTSIYLDENHDGVADNNRPLLIGGTANYSLSGYTIYGYSDTTAELNKDLSIYMYGGTVSRIYGLHGTSSLQRVKSTGSVKVAIRGGNVTEYTAAAYYAEAGDCELCITGGTFKGKVFNGYYSVINGNAVLQYGEKAVAKGTSSSTSSCVEIRNVQSTPVAKDAEIKLGALSYQYGQSYAYVYGCDNSTIEGNLNVTVDGNTSFNNCYLVYSNATIKGDFNMDWKAGSVYNFICQYAGTIEGDFNLDWEGGYASSVTCQSAGTIGGDFNVSVAENGTASGTIKAQGNVNANYKVRNERINIPVSNTGTVTVSCPHTNLEGYGWVNNKDAVTVRGNGCTIDKNMELTSLLISNGGECTIKEGVTVTVTGSIAVAQSIDPNAALYNYGDVTCGSMTIYGKADNSGILHAGGNVTIYAGAVCNNNGELTHGAQLYIAGSLNNAGTIQTPASTANYLQLVNTGTLKNEADGKIYIGCRAVNNGKIINYGLLKQSYTGSYRYNLGTVYTTTLPELSEPLTGYTTIYYPIEAAYPSQCVAAENVELGAVTGTYYKAPGEIDENAYMCAGQKFKITVGALKDDAYRLDSVTYGSEPNVAEDNHTQDVATYTGTMGPEPTVVTLNFVNSSVEEGKSITLDKNADTVEGLTVGTYNGNVYDLKSLKISGDADTEGEVTYSLQAGAKLPAGLYFRDGKIYGTPTTAVSEDVDVTFVVKGINQTTAAFTLTFKGIAKGKAALSLPGNLSSMVGNTLADVRLPYYSNGSFQWKDSSIAFDEVASDGKTFEVQFTPNDVANYDWEHATVTTNSEPTAYTYADGVITTTVSVKIYAGIPEYKDKIPESVTATYGQTFGEVALPSDEDGAFMWQAASTNKVGSVGNHYYYATYKPTNAAYQEVTDIRILVTVEKAEPVFTDEMKIESVNAVYGDTLADIELPAVTGGRYQWITQSSTVVQPEKAYKIGYKPADLNNYNWAGISGWNAAYGSVVFTVTANVAKATPQITGAPLVVEAELGQTLSTVALPVVKDGIWYMGEEQMADPLVSALDLPDGKLVFTNAEIRLTVTNKNAITVSFVPQDTEHYNVVENIRISVTLKDHEHVYGDWESDEEDHWQVCVCEETTEPEPHQWVEGDVTATGKIPYTCSVCGATKEEAHKHVVGEYEKNANQHWRICTICEARVGVEKHRWNDGEETAEGMIRYTCTVCGATKEQEKGHEHSYGDWQSDDDAHWQGCECGEQIKYGVHKWGVGEVSADGKVTYTCAICKKVKREDAPHNHVYGDWESDANGHWKQCECGEKSQEETHKWNDGNKVDGKITYTCSVCGRTKTENAPDSHKHEYGDWESDANGHWKQCACGEKSQEETHKWNDGKKAGNKITYTCTVCGKTKTENVSDSHKHEYGDWESDDDTHWKQCECGEITDPENHQWNAGEKANGKVTYTCNVCGAVKTANAPDVGNNSEEHDQPVTILAVGTTLTDEDENAVVQVTNPGTVDAQGDLADAEVVYLKPAKKMSKITIPDVVFDDEGNPYRVTSIASYAFKNDKTLTAVNGGDEIVQIGTGAFYGCTKLKTVTLGENLEVIGDKAFYKCSALTAVTIPANVTKIGKQAFFKCSKLKKITIKSATLKSVGSKAIYGINKKAVIKVPKKQLKAYKKLFKTKTGYRKSMKIRK